MDTLPDIPQIASAGLWPAGEHADHVGSASWKLAQREAFARYSLRAFAQAETATEAHAAWRLFLACVERGACAWIADILDQYRGTNRVL